MRSSSSPVRGAAAAGVAAIAIVTTPPARADPPPIRVDYQAHAACPAASVLLDEIARRTPLARVAAAREPALDVRARITARGKESRGHLVLGAGKGRVVREIASASCDEVVSAFALITALAIDPHASTAPRPPPAAPLSSPEPPATTAVEPTIAPPTIAPPTRAASPLARLAPQPPPAPIPSAPPVSAPSRGFWILGGGASITFAVAPRALAGGGVFVERAVDPAARASLRFAVEIAATGSFDVGPGGVSFLQAIGRLDGCAFGVRPVARLLLAPCVRAEGGALRGAGLLRGALIHAEAVTVPWLGLGIAPLASVDLARFVVELQGGPTFPLVRRSFRFDTPDYVIHDVPPVVWSLSLGAGVRFR
ncbi:MAG: hypothetical protein ABJE95_20810 [Byssovorax sp.]